MNPREPAHGLDEMPVRARIILGPDGGAVSPVAVAVRAVPAESSGDLWIHQPRECELSLLLPVGGKWKIIVLDARILPERALISEGGSEKRESIQEPPHNRL